MPLCEFNFKKNSYENVKVFFLEKLKLSEIPTFGNPGTFTRGER